MLASIGSLLILLQLIGIQSETQNVEVDEKINIVSDIGQNTTFINADDFINELFTKIAEKENLDKVVSVGYKKSRYHEFETAESGGSFLFLNLFL